MASPFSSTAPRPRELPDGVFKTKFNSRLMAWFEFGPLVSGEVEDSLLRHVNFAKVPALGCRRCCIHADNVLGERSQPQKTVGRRGRALDPV